LPIFGDFRQFSPMLPIFANFRREKWRFPWKTVLRPFFCLNSCYLTQNHIFSSPILWRKFFKT
jgi:hypothetical protein